MSLLPYDPGVLPTKPSPTSGEKLVIEVQGLPPFKDVSKSIRNSQHPRHSAFVDLRKAATTAMQGRAWYFGPVEIDLTLFAPALEPGRRLSDYAAGIEDTIDGSSGFTFTFLPIVFEDDCQVVSWKMHYHESAEMHYRLLITFL